MPTANQAESTAKRLLLAAVAALVVSALLLGYNVGRARAFGVPTVGTGTLTYTGSLLTFGQPDNSMHQISVALFASGATSAACAAGPSNIQVSNGQFTVPLPAACVGVIHQDPNVQVQVTVDTTTLGMTPLAAVPYAIEAGSASLSPLLSNVGVATSVASSALTVSLTQNDGASVPTPASPVIIGFRATSAGLGAQAAVQVTGPTSITVPSGATLGQLNGIASHVYVYAQDVAGAAQLCVSSSGSFDEGSLQSSVAISAGATATATLYCTVGATGPVRLVGRLLVAEAAAGTWATTPAEVAIPPFQPVPPVHPVTQQVFTSGSGTYYPSYVFTIAASNATAGATYTSNGQTFTVSSTISSQTTLIATGPGAPTASGTLALASGTGSTTITFSSYDNAPQYLEVTLSGGGGGGGTCSGGGVAGGATTFGTSLLTANGGGAGGPLMAGAGGSASIGAGAIGVPLSGSAGMPGMFWAYTQLWLNGGNGGSNPLGGAGAGAENGGGYQGSPGVPNTGAGGGGVGYDSSSGAGGSAGGGGGAGGYVNAIINSPASVYSYSVGASGGGAAAACGAAAGAGGSGVVIVREHY